MKVKVNEAERETLDYMVAMAEGLGLGLTKEDRFLEIFLHQNRKGYGYCYSRSWLQGGPIIEREGISVWVFDDVTWKAENPFTSGVDQVFEGPTPLIAAMRCYVASKLGDECDIPDELMREDKPDWRDPNSGCYCVVCLAPVREDIFVQRGGCCPDHKFDDECTYR